MILRNILNFISELIENIIKNIKVFYLNSTFYDKKISKNFDKELIYKPSPHLLSSLINYQKQKINISDVSTDNLWENKNIDTKDFKKLNNFYWFFSLDLKSPKKNTKKNYF